MKALFILLLTFSFSSSAGSLMDLFTDKTLRSKCLNSDFSSQSHLLIGIGVAKNLEKATDLALTDIAKQLKVSVKNEELLKSSKVDDKVSSSYRSATEISSNVKGLKGAKRECWDPNASNNRVVVVYSYDSRSLATKVADWLNGQNSKLASSTEISAPNVMLTSPFLHKVNTLTRNNKTPLNKLSLSLLFTNGGWELAANEQRFNIMDKDLFELIGNKVDPDVQIVSYNYNDEKFELVRKLKHNQEFKFAIREKDYSYVSVFNLLQDGRISELLANDEANGTQVVPADESLNFQAYVEAGQQQVKDIYILMFSDKPIGAHNFRKLELNESIGNDEYAYGIDKFLDWIDKQSIQMSIIQTTTFK